ncbi:unnamed protein product, partial [Didymodactylos carnosus]
CSTPTVPTSTTSDRRRATVSEGRPTTKITSNSSNNGLPLTKLKEKDEISQLPPPKSKSTLPVGMIQPGYITPSKLFNIMGYGLDNQYLFMHAHYLYVIDCR